MAMTLVLGYDGSDCSLVALAKTADLARSIPEVNVVVVYAYEFTIGYVPMGMTDSPLMMSAEYDEHVRLVREFGEAQVKDAAERLTVLGVGAETVVEEGRAAEVLLDAAVARNATMIVVGSHGEGAVSAAFLGSTALRLLHHSDIPVLVVPRHKKG